jgi:hypothetical protein
MRNGSPGERREAPEVTGALSAGARRPDPAAHENGCVVKLRFNEHRCVAEVPAGQVIVDVTADKHEAERHSFTVRDEVTQEVIGLR